MLSDEEKKSIEDLKDMIEKSKDLMEEEFYKLATIHNIQAVATVLNLIEKQSKEIEELRNEVMEKELIIDGIKEDRRIAVEEIQEQYYVSKDKIKAKIEELKAIADNGANAVRFAMTHEDEIERIQKQKDIGTMVEILQSLLEKEQIL